MQTILAHPYVTAVLILIAWNLVAFAVTWYDKRQAKRDGRRVKESTLFLFAALLGAVGVLAGMLTFRHKTQHVLFLAGIPLMLALNVLTIYGAVVLLR